MLELKDLRIGDDIYVISEDKVGIISEIKKKVNSDHYIITIEFPKGETFITTLDNLDDPKYRITPLGIIWSVLCDVLGDEFTNRENSLELAEEVLDKFKAGMMNANLLKIKKEED